MAQRLSYRRPSYVGSPTRSLSSEEMEASINESVTSGASCFSHGIPEALSFDKIITGGTCPPCTVRDFMNYLKYIEHSAENLQFYLWYLDYSGRFEKLPASERALSPAWSRTKTEADATAPLTSPRLSRHVDPQITNLLRDTEFAVGQPTIASEKGDPFHTPDNTPSLDEERSASSEFGTSNDFDRKVTSSSTHRSAADSAFESAGFKWKPFATQPYRDEISRIITTYLIQGASRELNLSDRERGAILHALQHTTHPSAVKLAATNVEYALRRQSHPNFIRWAICNGNRPRVIFARGLGIAGILGGLVADLLITLSHANRGWRALPFLAWFIGISTLIAAWKGMCVVLHGLHHRHLRPWELYSDNPGEVINEKAVSAESLISSSANSYEDEPWVAKYKKRNVIRKVFDRESFIDEPALRQIQDTIFLQAVLGSFILSAVIVGIFCAVPKGNLF